jgi:hypothetical protein
MLTLWSRHGSVTTRPGSSLPRTPFFESYARSLHDGGGLPIGFAVMTTTHDDVPELIPVVGYWSVSRARVGAPDKTGRNFRRKVMQTSA